MRENEKWNLSHVPSTGLIVIQFSILHVLESLIPKDQNKKTTLRWSERLFMGTTQHLGPTLVNIKTRTACQSKISRCEHMQFTKTTNPMCFESLMH